MGKEKKRSVPASSSDTVIRENYNALLDDIIEHLFLIRESKGLVIGSNAVFRGIEKRSIDVVLLVSRNAFPALYHALSSYCRNTDVLFFQLHDAHIFSFNSKIPASAAYGIKFKALNNEEKFSKLSEKIDRARNSLRCQREKKGRRCQTSDESPIYQGKEKTEELKTEEKDVSVQSLFHNKHVRKRIGAGFIGLNQGSEPDFPNYLALCEKISMFIK